MPTQCQLRLESNLGFFKLTLKNTGILPRSFPLVKIIVSHKRNERSSHETSLIKVNQKWKMPWNTILSNSISVKLQELPLGFQKKENKKTNTQYNDLSRMALTFSSLKAFARTRKPIIYTKSLGGNLQTHHPTNKWNQIAIIMPIINTETTKPHWTHHNFLLFTPYTSVHRGKNITKECGRLPRETNRKKIRNWQSKKDNYIKWMQRIQNWNPQF